MSNYTTNQIRDKFLGYFADNGHTKVQASSLIPHNDPTLMFVNSGMVQFKNVFTGLEDRPYTKATSSQKSVRAGGKHNDLDNVGYTARHHTFFEMLGNFSFGDYFKEEAIYFAWNLLTKEFGLDKNKLYATVYHTDDEAASYWKKIAGFSDDRIIRIDTNDNFWSMGDTGPCGPCSEIFYDHGGHIPGGLPGTPEQDGDRFIEIWNMVFMQFEQIDKDTRIELPKKSIDTGMGLERVTAILQNVHDNYDIDLFRDLISVSADLTGRKAEGDALFSHRIIADHLRSSAFLIADGVMPSNEGRGYVLRRIMRRAMRHAHQLGARDPLMYRLFPKLVDLMGGAYPELKRAETFVSDILKQEEERFKVTLDRGLKLLQDESSTISAGGSIPGDVAFKLYDTYGFPLDLTEDILKSKNIAVDHQGFNAKMEEQKIRARSAWSGSGDAASDKVWFELKNKFGSTEFLGYSLNQAEAQIIALEKKDDHIIIVTNQTPFYGESGGQMGDVGTITHADFTAKVIDTKKFLGIIAHICEIEKGQPKIGDVVALVIDEEYRRDLKAHHSATHILHAVLREVLGGHVTQKGSLVSHDRLRFDISQPKALSKEEIRLIEDRVNNIITHNSSVRTVLMGAEEAMNSGAMALFGEKYDSEVRVVSLGAGISNESPYSIELCGGTHVSRTGDIGCFKIISESAIAAGVRRIEAVCGKAAILTARENEDLINELTSQIKAPKSEALLKIGALLQSKKDLEKELMDLKISQISFSSDQIKKEAIIKGQNKLIYRALSNFDIKAMRSAAEDSAKKDEDLFVVLISNNDGKIAIVVAAGKSAAERVAASDLASYISSLLGGTGGGGSKTLAQAGASSVEGLAGLADKVLEKL
jgi:alanyl-tRNA synthetase